MKLIIAGSRTIHLQSETLHDLIYSVMKPYVWPDMTCTIKEVVSGHAKGIDQAGELFAKEYDIPMVEFRADWEKHGNYAGPIRNGKMGEYADALFLVWDGQSKGSQIMKDIMIKKNKPIYEVIIRKL